MEQLSAGGLQHVCRGEGGRLPPGTASPRHALLGLHKSDQLFALKELPKTHFCHQTAVTKVQLPCPVFCCQETWACWNKMETNNQAERRDCGHVQRPCSAWLDIWAGQIHYERAWPEPDSRGLSLPSLSCSWTRLRLCVSHCDYNSGSAVFKVLSTVY